MRRRVASRSGSPGSVTGAGREALPRRPDIGLTPAPESTNGARALEWLELAEGTTREALAERLAQAHLIDRER